MFLDSNTKTIKYMGFYVYKVNGFKPSQQIANGFNRSLDHESLREIG